MALLGPPDIPYWGDKRTSDVPNPLLAPTFVKVRAAKGIRTSEPKYECKGFFKAARHIPVPARRTRPCAPAAAVRKNPSPAWPRRAWSRCAAARPGPPACRATRRSEEHTSELQSCGHLVCRLLLEKKK